MRSYRGKAQRAVATSDDGGQTWSACRDEPALPEPVCQGSLIRYTWPKEGDATHRSRLLFSNPASTKSRDHLTVRMSYDEGGAWPVSRTVCEGSSAYSNLVALADGTIGLLYERDDYGRIAFARITLEWLSRGKDKLQ
jgi:sialidase-1